MPTSATPDNTICVVSKHEVAQHSVEPAMACAWYTLEAHTTLARTRPAAGAQPSN